MINKPELTLCTVNKRQPDGLPRTASYTEMEDRLHESMWLGPPARTSLVSYDHALREVTLGAVSEWDLRVMMGRRENECQGKKCFMS